MQLNFVWSISLQMYLVSKSISSTSALKFSKSWSPFPLTVGNMLFVDWKVKLQVQIKIPWSYLPYLSMFLGLLEGDKPVSVANCSKRKTELTVPKLYQAQRSHYRAEAWQNSLFGLGSHYDSFHTGHVGTGVMLGCLSWVSGGLCSLLSIFCAH